MNRIEKEKCIEMMIEGICSGKFAEGINQVLVSIGFKHPKMEELSKLI